jgi:hypothetical protein
LKENIELRSTIFSEKARNSKFAPSIAARLQRRKTAEAPVTNTVCNSVTPKSTQRPLTNSKFIIGIVFGYCCGLID